MGNIESREKARYNNAPLRDRPHLPRTTDERAQRWHFLLAEKNRLISELRAANYDLQGQVAALRARLHAEVTP